MALGKWRQAACRCAPHRTPETRKKRRRVARDTEDDKPESATDRSGASGAKDEYKDENGSDTAINDDKLSQIAEEYEAPQLEQHV